MQLKEMFQLKNVPSGKGGLLYKKKITKNKRILLLIKLPINKLGE